MTSFDQFMSSWSWDPLVAVVMGLLLGLYLSGTLRLRSLGRFDRGLGWPRASAYFLAVFVVFIALSSPIDTFADALLTFHMVQHMLLILVAAPLLLLGRPMTVVFGALPNRPLRLILTAGRVKAVLSFIGRPVVAWAIAAAVLWVWHLPALYNAAVQSYWLHSFQHFFFFASGILFWWPVINYPARMFPYPLRMVYVLAAAVQSSWLGAVLTLTDEGWYSVYQNTTASWGLTPLDDQQLGGLIMWVPGGIIYLLALTVVFFSWMGFGEEDGGSVEVRPAK